MLNEKKVVPKLRQEVKVKVDIVTSDDIKIYYTGKFQDFTARYIIKITLQWYKQCHEDSINCDNACKQYLHKCARKYGSRGPPNKADLHIANYRQFHTESIRRSGSKASTYSYAKKKSYFFCSLNSSRRRRLNKLASIYNKIDFVTNFHGLFKNK